MCTVSHLNVINLNEIIIHGRQLSRCFNAVYKKLIEIYLVHVHPEPDKKQIINKWVNTIIT